VKVNKLLAFVLVVLTITLLGNQLLASTSSQAAPLAGNGITATLSQPASNQPTDQSPTRLTVQGRLTTPGGLPVTTATNFAFKLYNVASGGTALYSEPTTSITPDASGLFTFEFGADGGSFASIFSGTLYLGVTIASDAEMTPRIKVNGAAYAFSLAPGAVISGSYPNVAGRYGVVNAINTDTSNPDNAGLYARGATGVRAESSTSGSANGTAGYFYNFGGGTGNQYGVYANTFSTGGAYGTAGFFNNYGGGSGGQLGIFAATRSIGGSEGYAGFFDNQGGGSATQFGVYVNTNSTYGTDGVAGFFRNVGGGSGAQYGVYANTDSNRGTEGYAGYFYNSGRGSGAQYGVYAQTNSIGSASSYTGYFYNGGSGTGLQYGIYTYGSTYSAYFDSPSATSTSVYAAGAVSAQSFIDRPGAYSIMVRYNGTTPLQAGEVLAFDGNNPTVDGTQYVGTSKATAATAALAVGVASQRMARLESDRPTQPTSKDGQPAGKQVSWTIDQAATSFQPGDMIRVVVLGQVQVKASTAKFGDHLGLSASGDYRVAAASDERIGTVISQPDKDGKVTLFVNFK